MAVLTSEQQTRLSELMHRGLSYRTALALADVITQGDIDALGTGVLVPLSVLAAAPDQMAVGTVARSANEAAIGFAVAWPDGATGVFVGTESTLAQGAIDSYTVTHVLNGVTKTYTQPALTRDGSGAVTNRPAITVT